MAASEGKSKGGLMALLVPIVAVTLIGGGGGAFLGFSLLAPKEPEKGKAVGQGAQSASDKEAAEAGAKDATKGEAHGGAKSEAHGGGSEDAHGGGHAKPEGHGKAEAHGDAHGKDAHGKEGEKKAEEPPLLQVKELPPVVTSLSGATRRTWCGCNRRSSMTRMRRLTRSR